MNKNQKTIKNLFLQKEKPNKNKMQEVNELKALVVQSLEANGILGQLRAQLRASVFKVNSEKYLKKKKKERE